MGGYHTPGPWQIGHRTFPGKRFIYQCRGGGGHAVVEIIAEINEGAFHADGNARLLSAAPQLLAACQRVLEHCHRCDLGPIADQVEAAIAKATGTYATKAPS